MSARVHCRVMSIIITPSSCRDALLGIFSMSTALWRSNSASVPQFHQRCNLAKMAILFFCNAKRKRDCTPLSSDDVVDEETALCQVDEHSYAASTANADFAYVYQV